MPVTISESDAFPTTLTAPQAGESASAPALISEFLQGIANRSRWLFNRVNVFVAGGTLSSSADVQLSTATGTKLRFNGLEIKSAIDSGDALTWGVLTSMHRVQFPDCSSSGTKAIPYDADYVFPGGFGSPVTSGVIWQVATPPSGSTVSAVGRCWVMKLVNPNSGAVITVKDAGGATLATLQSTSGAVRACTIAFDGSAWQAIDFQWRP